MSGTNYNKSWNFDNLAVGEFVIELNEKLALGNYTIDLKGTTGGVKSQTNNVSNQSIADVISFYTGGGNTDWYGMFFDWNVSIYNAADCRTPIEVVLDPSNEKCVLTSFIPKENKTIHVYPNPSENGIFELNTPMPWKIISPLGEILLNGQDKIIDLSCFENGIYFLHISQKVIALVQE